LTSCAGRLVTQQSEKNRKIILSANELIPPFFSDASNIGGEACQFMEKMLNLRKKTFEMPVKQMLIGC
jgi:hypothetical protein